MASAVQTSVSVNPAVGQPGLEYDDSFSDIVSWIATVAIPFGVLVYESAEGKATLPTATGNVTGGRVGIALIDHNKPSGVGYEIGDVPADRLAVGYRWENDAFAREPSMPRGAFGAMGGVHTSANDYAKWVAFLLSAWPPRDGPDTGPVKRATVRLFGVANSLPRLSQRMRPGNPAPCAFATVYSAGFNVVQGATKDKVLTVDVGSSVVAQALKYLIQFAPDAASHFGLDQESLAKMLWARLPAVDGQVSDDTFKQIVAIANGTQAAPAINPSDLALAIGPAVEQAMTAFLNRLPAQQPQPAA